MGNPKKLQVYYNAEYDFIFLVSDRDTDNVYIWTSRNTGRWIPKMRDELEDENVVRLGEV